MYFFLYDPSLILLQILGAADSEVSTVRHSCAIVKTRTKTQKYETWKYVLKCLYKIRNLCLFHVLE
jgi:hypothetical protein